MSNVLVQEQGGLAEVQLNRPDKLNAIDLSTFVELVDVATSLACAPAVRAVVLMGNGRSFSVGIDLESLSDSSGIIDRLGDHSRGEGNLFQQSVLKWHRLPIPVVAAIQGHALGGGLQLALGADIRIVAPDARISVREIAWGLIPDMAGTVLLRRLLRDDVIRDLVFSGRIISGEEAYGLGLATRLANDPVTAARNLAREIASLSPDAVRAAKRLLNAGASGAPDDRMLAAEASEQRDLLASFNHKEAVAAQAEKRLPLFRD